MGAIAVRRHRNPGAAGLAIGAVAAVALIVSVVAVFPAFSGVRRARQANDLASVANAAAAEANVIAADANSIASTAHDLARQQERRATEQHDVEWTIGWVNEHHLFIANQGLDAAHQVRYRITMPGNAMRNDGPDIVAPWNDFELPSDVTLSVDALRSTTIMSRIVWNSAAGTPHREFLTVPGAQVWQHRRAVG